jgi:hypothetical protein
MALGAVGAFGACSFSASDLGPRVSPGDAAGGQSGSTDGAISDAPVPDGGSAIDQVQAADASATDAAAGDTATPVDAAPADAAAPDGPPADGPPAPDLAPDLGPDLAPDVPPPPPDAATNARLLINEANTSARDWVEIWNPTPYLVDVSGWVVGFGTTSAYQTFTIPAGTLIRSGGFIQVLEGDGTNASDTFYTTLTIGWASAASGEVTLRNAGGAGIDYVSFRNPAGAGPNKPADTGWSGAIVGGGNTVNRNTRTDTDTSADWVVRASNGGTPKALNPGQ